jgi:imidazolonepropionase-like amidohydrolase
MSFLLDFFRMEEKMMTLIQKGLVFAPQPLGKKDVLILNDKIGAISEPGKIKVHGVDFHLVDASEKIAIPGFIDSHVHILGGRTGNQSPRDKNRGDHLQRSDDSHRLPGD